jgi:competence protein ComEC
MDDSPHLDAKLRPLPFLVARPLVCLTLCYGTGVLLGASRQFHWLWAVGLFAACLFSLVFILSGRISALGLFPVFFFLGLVLASLSANPVRPPEGDHIFLGTVEGRVRYKEEGQVVCTLTGVAIDGIDFAGNMYWSFYVRDGEAPPVLENGCRVAFSGRLYYPNGLQNPHGFDFDLYLKQRYITACLYGQNGLTVTPPQSVWEGSFTFRLRAELTQALYKTMGEKAALASVMLLGADDQLPEESREDLRITGTAHILSISGLHIAYLAAMVVWLLKLLGVRPKARFFIVAAFLAFYSWLVGMSAPVIRSSLMFLAFLGAKLLGRAHDPLTSISAVCLILLLVKPLDLLSPSFQLSFGAVSAMLILGEPLLKWQNKHFPGKRRRINGRIRQFLHQQWQSVKALPALGITAQIGVALPLAAWYNQVSLLGIFVNLLVIPYVAVLMLAFLLALVLSPLGITGQIAGTVAGWLTDVLLGTVRLAADVPGMAVNVPSPALPIILGTIAFLLLLSPYVLFRGRRRALMLAAVAVLTVGGGLMAANRDVRYIQLSVGDADAAILEDGAYTAVIDTGETGAEAADYLLGEGRSVDALILSHLHLDHAGGIMRLLNEGVEIRCVYIPEGAETALSDSEGLMQLSFLREIGIPVIPLHAGDKLTSPRTELTVLWPKKDAVRPNQDANQSSLVACLQMVGVSLLTTGDITGEYEMYAASKADILKVPHHGSANSTGNDFLIAIDPQMALLSCSGLIIPPSPKTLERLAGQKIPLYRTDQSGAVTLLIRGGHFEAHPFLKE